MPRLKIRRLRSSPLSPIALFTRNLFRHPTMLGAVVPCSPFLINDMLAAVEWDRAKVIVEYGPGIGNITEEILKRMAPDATLIVIELNREFADYLRERVRDPRVHLVRTSASHVREVLAGLGLPHADYIISSLPFGAMPGSVRQHIMRETRSALRADGVFVAYQYSGVMLPFLRTCFRSVQQGFQPLNIPPARIFSCTP